MTRFYLLGLGALCLFGLFSFRAIGPALAQATPTATPSGTASAAPSATPAATSSGQVPTIPSPTALQLDPSTTAFLALDFNNAICGANPVCVATVPAVSGAIDAARAAGATIVYSTTATGNGILDDVHAQSSDATVTSGADKFFNTNLDDILKQNNISTVVITGTVTNGAVLFTSFGATNRGYTVVVPVDGVSARSDFATAGSLWQVLNGPGGNTQNTPLQPKAVTLSRTDMITYK
jgi:nicotinamidase-related amidase